MPTAPEIKAIKTRPEYLAVAAAGKKAVRPGLVVQYRAPEGAGPARVGLTVSARAGGAVERSRIKRRLRQVIKQILPGLAEPGAKYVVIGRRAALKRPFEDLKKDLQSALSTLHSKPTKRTEK